MEYPGIFLSAQEAVYILLQFPMRKSSHQVIFVNTSPREERVHLLKHVDDIKKLEDDFEDVFTGGLLKRYAKRAVGLEHVTLADWAAWYDSCSSTYYVRQSKLTDIDHLPLETCNQNQNDDEQE